jgi:hypothetical protein
VRTRWHGLACPCGPQLDVAAHSPHNHGPATMQVSIAVTGDACLPTLEIQDVLSNSMARVCAWSCFNVSTLNEQLAGTVSSNERWLEDQEAQHGMDLKDVIANMTAVEVHFGIVCPGQASIMRIWLVNTGCLPARCQIGGSDLPDLELENWVEPSLPRNEEESLADFVKEHRIFQYHPHTASLAPGEGCEVPLLCMCRPFMRRQLLHPVESAQYASILMSIFTA